MKIKKLSNPTLELIAKLPIIEKKHKTNSKIKTVKQIINKYVSKLNKTEKTVFYYKIGYLQFQMGFYETAKRSFTQSLENIYEFTSSILMRAFCYYKLGQLDLACEEATSALIYEPDAIIPNEIKAFFDYKNNYIEESKLYTYKVLKRGHNTLISFYLNAKINFEQNKAHIAKKYLEKTNNDNSHFLLKFLYAKILLYEGNENGAIKTFKKITFFPPALYYYGELLLKSNNLYEAKKSFLHLLNSKNYTLIALYKIANIQLRNRIFLKSANNLIKILKNKKWKLDTLSLLTKALYLNKDYTWALRFIKIADKMAGNINETREKKISILKLKFKIQIKLNLDKNECYITLKRIENLVQYSDTPFFTLVKFYTKLYRIFPSKKILKKTKELKKIIDTPAKGTTYITYSGNLRKWVLITIACLILILITLEIISIIKN